ncbi:MAG TPA: hypothetical protein VLQ78_04235 [Ornithinibacter sp.]|nr:hypothetical protein [Ornithinibacter sp.]
MGLFDRIRGRGDDATAPDGTASDGTAPDLPDEETGGSLEGVEPVESVGTRPLTAQEQASLDTVRAAYAAHGIDPSDLATVATAYDLALERHDGGDETAADAVTVIGTAIGDHLVVTGGYRWVMSTDPFGTDLAVEPPRRGMPVVTRMLVAVRWLARERGWVVGVTGHLVRLGRS